ncbi:MAG: hypothetical protein ACRDD8_12140 [Bacteroidales bacterium]
MAKLETREFLGMDVRVIDDEFVPLKDIFKALGRVKEDGTWTNEKNKLMQFLEDVDKLSAHQLLVVASKTKKSKSRETQEMECLKLETIPIVLTQFRPTNSNKRTKEENKFALETWRSFMRFIDDLLTTLEIHEYIVVDKQHQKDHITNLIEMGGKPVVINQMVNKIMGELIGIEGSIKKDELRQYQNQTTVDLLEVREFVLSKFENAYEFTSSHKDAKEMTLKLALIKYPKLV